MTGPLYPDYLDLLIRGHVEQLLSYMSDTPTLHDPEANLKGRDGVGNFLEHKSEWLRIVGAQAERVRLTATARRGVDEQVLTYTEDDKPISLPYAIVMERDPDEIITDIRVYHSYWPIIEGHKVRPPILPEVPGLHMSGAPGTYHKALATGDLDGIMAAFEDSGYVREPAGNQYVYHGRDSLRDTYAMMFKMGGGGGIGLEYCTVTDDGAACALEYNAVRWGQVEFTPQAGVAVYERGETGRLAAARIYDDVDTADL